MSNSRMVDVVVALMKASEKAANIARACCKYGAASLLVSEKGDGEANTLRFDKDFKTIADVLAQVCAINEIEANCEGLAKNVRGEENTEIRGVTIELKNTEEETAELLSTLVPPDIAKCLAEAAHSETSVTIPIEEIVPSDFPDVDPSDFGVWIDPIDATEQFIAGVNGEENAEKGLACVTVLIGAYLKSSGEPIFGVINQPYYSIKTCTGCIIWGICYGDVCKWGMPGSIVYAKTNTILLSFAEEYDFASKLKSLGWDIEIVPGAGHKLMKVGVGQAEAYILSKGTTFRWDTCAPHCIIKARGGEILDYTTRLPLTYNDPENLEPRAYCNTGGIIAFGNYKTYDKLKVILDDN